MIAASTNVSYVAGSAFAKLCQRAIKIGGLAVLVLASAAVVGGEACIVLLQLHTPVAGMRQQPEA